MNGWDLFKDSSLEELSSLLEESLSRSELLIFNVWSRLELVFGLERIRSLVTHFRKVHTLSIELHVVNKSVE